MTRITDGATIGAVAKKKPVLEDDEDVQNPAAKRFDDVVQKAGYAKANRLFERLKSDGAAISRSAFYGWRSGSQDPTLSPVLEVCDLLGVTPYVIARNETPEQTRYRFVRTLRSELGELEADVVQAMGRLSQEARGRLAGRVDEALEAEGRQSEFLPGPDWHAATEQLPPPPEAGDAAPGRPAKRGSARKRPRRT